MNILIIGNGGREHALAWKVAQSAQVDKVFVAPGNAGTAREPKVYNVPIAPLASAELRQFAQDNQIGLTIVGPEAPLAAGIVDAFQQVGLPCFGPSQQAAQLEASKAFSKAFMARHHIPTATYAVFTDLAEAKAYVATQPLPIVIKADGLAAGKGVVIAQNLLEAQTALAQMLATPGSAVVIEEYLTGQEVSFIVVTNGKAIVPLATAQDHKTRDNGDVGPNTGGMGAYSPAPLVDAQLHTRILAEIIAPTLAGMAAEGHPYCGFLYAGLMVSPQGDPKVLEFNCRLGDPETQAILFRLKSDLVTLCQAALSDNLANINLDWDPRPALTVVLAAGGYPEHYQKGDVITGPTHLTLPELKVFHAGTALQGEDIVTQGGRVLAVTALGDTLAQAQQQAYQAIQAIHWRNMHYRTDIGHRALVT